MTTLLLSVHTNERGAGPQQITANTSMKTVHKKVPLHGQAKSLKASHSFQPSLLQGTVISSIVT